jgi:hypothetical protein
MRKFWFEEEFNNDRRSPENRLRRIAKESERQEEGLINGWLDLAKRLFDSDDDPEPDAA